MSEIPEVTRAKEFLRTIKFATMATVNEDGSPHNTPFLFLQDQELTHIYWGSHPKSQHSKNIQRTGQLFIVIFDAFKTGGLYLKASEGHSLEGDDLDAALEIHNIYRKRDGLEELEKNYYTGSNPQKMWSAKITNYWVNATEKDLEGHIIRDFRIEVKREDLI